MESRKTKSMMNASVKRSFKGKTILDPCCGGKAFWFDKNNPNVFFVDKRTESHILCDGCTIKIKPDLNADFRQMPFKSGSFKLVVFDPPHLNKLGKSSWMAKKYGVLGADWEKDIQQGFSECFRVLEDYGILIFKWSENQIKISEVLALTPMKPLFGHRTMINNNTIWLCFIKLPT